MTIKKGENWGVAGPLPPGGVIVGSDAAARAVVTRALAEGAPPPALALHGGDLARTMGAPATTSRFDSGATMQLPVDLGVAVLDGRRHYFVAHAVARRSWWRGRCIAAMNAEWLGPWDVAPRSHPNDGLLDVLDGDLGLDDRLKVRSRLPTGQHVPHPGIHVSRVSSVDVELDRPLTVWLDGERVGAASSLHFEVLPDALLCIV